MFPPKKGAGKPKGLPQGKAAPARKSTAPPVVNTASVGGNSGPMAGNGATPPGPAPAFKAGGKVPELNQGGFKPPWKKGGK